MKSIVVISHALVVKDLRQRWHHLADKGWNVHLIIPRYWVSTRFDEKIIYRNNTGKSGNLYVHTLLTTNNSVWRTYFLIGLLPLMIKLKPDFVYTIHEEDCLIHFQISLISMILRKTKYMFFTMKSRKIFLNRFYRRMLWNIVRKYTVAAFVHCPDAVGALKRANFEKLITIQTQIGINELKFKKYNQIDKDLSRKKYMIPKDKFVIGYLGRFIEEKGLLDLFRAIFEIYQEKSTSFLLVLAGGDRKIFEKNIYFKKLEKLNLIKTYGFIPQNNVAEFMNCIDIFYTGSHTTKSWVDTFCLGVVQAQLCGIPVVASDSGSLPWQLSNSALIFKEKNIIQLKQKIVELMNNAKLRNYYSKKGLENSYNRFSTIKLSEQFSDILKNHL